MNKIVKNTIILSCITLVAGLLLGVVYEVTKGPIASAQGSAKQKACATVLSEADSFETLEDFDAEEAASILTENGYGNTEIKEVEVGLVGNEEVGYVITVVSHEGYAGDIEISVGILNDGTVKGIEMLTITETAGLGMKAKDPEFKDQFKDKQVEKFSYTKTGEKGDDKINAISGATITTSAVTNAVDAALVYFQNLLGGSGNE